MASQLLPRHVFGLNVSVKDNLHYVDDNVVLYPAGRTLVLYSTDSRTQRFIQGSEGTDGITAIALSPSRKYLAVAERAEKAMITVFDLTTLKRRKVLTSSEVGSKVCVLDRCLVASYPCRSAQGYHPHAGVFFFGILCRRQTDSGAGRRAGVESDHVVLGEGQAGLRHQASAQPAGDAGLPGALLALRTRQ